ncbi:MAG: hypothetical protein GF311_09675 [Candidatus Lokiarchaeota archaeon]|nr:hypothetical protein [Candidatus Lokiarchaeota archaeon]
MLLPGDYVRIKKPGINEGRMGLCIGFDNILDEYKIQVLFTEKEIYCEKSEVQKITEKQFNELIPKLQLDGCDYFLFDYDLKSTSEVLRNNVYLKGLYALGYYFPTNRYPEKNKEDPFSQTIIKFKNHQYSALSTGEKLAADIFTFFLNSKTLKSIISDVEYCFLMPTTKNKNHVSYWTRPLINKLRLKDISDYVYIVKKLDYYKYKKAYERKRMVKDAILFKPPSNERIQLQGKKALIFDDICTTGNQINELTNTLNKHGINEVYAFVLGKSKK